MTETSRSSRLFLWHGRSLVVGPGIDSSPHAHFAAQLTVALERPFRVRLGASAPWVDTEAAIFAPNQRHQLDCGGGVLAHVFVELPQRQQTIGSLAAASYHHMPEFAEVTSALRGAMQGFLDYEGADRAIRQWLACALPLALMPQGYDARIARALAWMHAHPGAAPDGAFLASLAHLSPSRFTHLFRQQTGLSLSRYLLWTRLLDAVAAVARGGNITHAAHRAGFSDLAHMSRTFRSTFGVVPSELQKMTITFKQSGE